jgi:8-oxo-dGTP diphosphatase
MKYEYNFPMASLATDIFVHHENKVLLIKRGGPPYQGCYALPGGFVEIASETFQKAAQRELREETNLDIPIERFYFITLLDNPTRDTRGRVVSAVFGCQLTADEVYYAVAGDDAAAVEWVDFNDVINNKVPVAFDHLLVFEKMKD